MLRNVKTRTGRYVHRAHVYEVHGDLSQTRALLPRSLPSLSISVVCNQVPSWNYSLAVTEEKVTCPKCLRKKR